MKSSIKKDTFKAIYRLLDKVSPIDGDCGRLCGSLCCTYEPETASCQTGHEGCSENAEACCEPSEGSSLGIYLLPGEEKLFTGHEDWLEWDWEYAEDYEFPDNWHGKVYFLKCLNAPSCHRQMRPLQCRVFPLTPHLDQYGQLYMIYQSGQLPYKCPLIHEKIKLNEDFLKANYTVWKHLLRDPLIFDLVEMDSAFREDDGENIVYLYP